MSDEQIKKHFKFEDADLHDNRNGVLSSGQLKRIAGQDNFNNSCIAFVGFFLIGCVILVLANKIFAWWGIPAAVLVSLGLAALMNVFSRSNYEVLKVEGPIRNAAVEFSALKDNQLRHDYELYIGDHKFDVDRLTRYTIAQYTIVGDIYAFYYLDKTKEIVSLELIAKGE
jgi:hypothetical protein